MESESEFSAIKGIPQPARRALGAAGYTKLSELQFVTEMELPKLHAMGTNALKVLRESLANREMSFQPGGE